MFVLAEAKPVAAKAERSVFAAERKRAPQTDSGPVRRVNWPGAEVSGTGAHRTGGPRTGPPRTGLPGTGPRWSFATVPIHARAAAGALQAKLAIGAVNDPLEVEADQVAERVVGMGDNAGRLGSSGELALRRCAKCQEEEEKLRRKSAGGDGGSRSEAPASVDHALRGAGKPIDEATRAHLEPRFGYDFSQVRLHTDDGAARSAGEIGARAYTVGRQIVFGAGQYNPGSAAGRWLLAHELTHVVQQNAAGAMHGLAAGAVSGQASDNLVQRAPNPLDAQSKAIIEAAKNTKGSAEDRAKALVNSIVNQYYTGEKDKVDFVAWIPAKVGLSTLEKGRGSKATGVIEVGQQFLDQAIAGSQDFARSVLQVGHELQHVEQHRQGMGGEKKSHEREFLAYYWEATQQEQAGTGRVSHPTRVDLIDAALGNFYCLSATEQESYDSKKTELLTRRDSEEGKYKDKKKHPKTNPPTTCDGKATAIVAPPATSTSPPTSTTSTPPEED